MNPETEVDRLTRANRAASDRVVGYARGIARALREGEQIGELSAQLFIEAVESQRDTQEKLMRAISEVVRHG